MKIKNFGQRLRHSLAGGERKNLAEKETATTGDATTEEEEDETVGRRETIVIVMGGAEVAAITRI